MGTGQIAPPLGTEGRPSSAELDLECATASTSVEQSLAALLLRVGDKVDGILERIPQEFAEARRFIDRELWPQPRPEEIQTLVKIAGDRGAEGARREVPRRFIAMRLVANSQIRRFWGAPIGTAAEIRMRASALQAILDRSVLHEGSAGLLEASPGGLSIEDLDYLRGVVKALSPPREPLLSAVTLAPWLAGLLDAASRPDLRSVVPSLTDEEASLFQAQPDLQGSPEEPMRRTCHDVAALRWLMHEDTAAWEKLAPATEASDETDARAELLVRFAEHEVTYRFVSERLRKLQDTAVLSWQREIAEWLNRFRRPLVASFTRLAPILKKQPAAGAAAPASQNAAAAGPIEEIFHQALTGLKPREADLAAARAESSPGSKRYRKRVAGLTVTTVVLAGAAVLVHALLPKGPPRQILVHPSDFANAASLTAAQSVGTMLYAQVSASWDTLSDSERLREVGALGRLAAGRGFAAVHMVQQGGEPVAEWDRSRGARLVVSPR